MEVQVSFRGKPLRVEGLHNTTPVAHLKDRLEEITKVPVEKQKLILKGKTLQNNDESLEGAGIVSRAGATRRGADDATWTQTTRLMLVGSTSSEVRVVHALRADTIVRNDFDGGVAIPKGFKKVALNVPSGPLIHSPYRFERIETLPGLVNEDQARNILESLADDPGVRSVLEKHKWTVGALCELYPEGKVGISKVCVMGLNTNHGEKIQLRLRTDDLSGFRKILSIKKVLFHELAHNDISEHDDSFYQLMRQIENEAAELDWRRQAGRTLSNREVAGLPGNERGYILVKEAFEGGSGRLGGESEALTHMFSPKQLAAKAAILRLTPEEQEVEDCCGHSMAPATGKERSLVEPAVAGSEEGSEGEPANAVVTSNGEVEEKGDASAPDAEGATVDSDRDNDHPMGAVDGARKDMAVETMDGDVNPLSSGALSPKYQQHQHDKKLLQHRGREEGAPVEATGNPAPRLRTPMDVAEDAAPAANDPHARQLPPLSWALASPLDELSAMGFTREAAVEALAATGGSVPDAAFRLLTPGLSDARVEGESDPATGEGGRGQGPRSSRGVRVQQAAERIAGHSDHSRAVKCLEVLEAMFRNIMEHPAEEKFRRVRRSNRKFKVSVGSVTGAMELLLAAGFEVRGDDQLELGRQDPGLIWLAKSTVEGWRMRLAA